MYGGDFAKFCGLLRIYELYLLQKKFPPIVGNLKAEEGGDLFTRDNSRIQIST